MTDIKEGTLWGSSDGKKFRVIHIIEQSGHTWIHYRDESKGPFALDNNPKEYSCYVESFLQRFTRTPE